MSDFPVLPTSLSSPNDFNALREFARQLKENADRFLELVEGEGPKTLLRWRGSRLQTIQIVVANFYQKDLSIMRSKMRTADVAWARQVAMVFCREFTGLTLQETGQAFGGRDHGTVMHAIYAVKDRCECEPGVKEDIANLRRHFAELFKEEVAA